MQKSTSRLFGAAALFLYAIGSGRAQNGELQTLRIELKSAPGSPPREYVLELYDFRSHQKVGTADPQSDGAFTLRHVPYGDYQIALLDSGGNSVQRQFITVSGVTAPVVIDLMGPQSQRPPAGPVSVSQLRHPPARKAFQAVQAAQRFSEAGDYEKAAEELQRAVRISPYYVEAYTNLAVQHVRMNRFEEAASELARALEIGGPNTIVLTDLACAQVAIKRYGDAVQSARAALLLQPGYPQAHYILGLALSTSTATVREGLEHLRLASQTFPQAQAQIERVQRALAAK